MSLSNIDYKETKKSWGTYGEDITLEKATSHNSCPKIVSSRLLEMECMKKYRVHEYRISRLYQLLENTQQESIRSRIKRIIVNYVLFSFIVCAFYTSLPDVNSYNNFFILFVSFIMGLFISAASWVICYMMCYKTNEDKKQINIIKGEINATEEMTKEIYKLIDENEKLKEQLKAIKDNK